MTPYYVNNAGDDGDGTLGNPWNNVAGHIDTLAAGDRMLIFGNVSAPARIYNEPQILCAANGTQADVITIKPYAVAENGKRFLLHTPGPREPAVSYTVVAPWTARLK